MKVFLFALLLCGAFASDAGDQNDPKEGIQEQLSSMMSAANDNLAKAEDIHKKAIEKARNDITFGIGDASRAVEQQIGEYAGALVKAWTDLDSTMNISKAGLSKEAAKPITAGDWNGPGFAERAKLGAAIGATERLLKRSERQRTRQLQLASAKAESNFEDETQKLAWKLGDLSQLTDEAKQGIEAEVDEIQTNFTRNTTASKATLEKAKKDDEQGRLVAFEGNLDAATKKYQAEEDAALKKVNTFLAKEGKAFSAQAAALAKDVDDAQKKALSGSFGDIAPKLAGAAKAVKKASSVKPNKH